MNIWRKRELAARKRRSIKKFTEPTTKELEEAKAEFFKRGGIIKRMIIDPEMKVEKISGEETAIEFLSD